MSRPGDAKLPFHALNCVKANAARLEYLATRIGDLRRAITGLDDPDWALSQCELVIGYSFGREACAVPVSKKFMLPHFKAEIAKAEKEYVALSARLEKARKVLDAGCGVAPLVD